MTQEELNYIKDSFSQIIDDIAGNPEWYEAARAIASELGSIERELEDERIRESLVEYFSKFNPADMWDDNFSFSQILAYLEKQKDNKFAPRVLPCSAAWFEDGEEKQKEKSEKPIIPEKENEVMNAIEGVIRVYGKTQGAWIVGYDMDTLVVHLRKAFAALEKQKEQKPAEYLDKDKVYAIMSKLTNLSFSQRIPIDSDEFKKIDEITSDVRSLLDYPIEQKPVEIHIDNPNIKKLDPDVKITTSDSSASGDELLYVCNKSYKIGYRDGKRDAEQKPINNSTREKIISRATSEKQVVLVSESDGNAEIGWDTRSLEDAKNLLEYGISFISKQLGVKPAEWSEDDESKLNHILEIVHIAPGSEVSVDEKEELESFLKSLRPHWKPSEEQMQFLLAVINDPNNISAESCYMTIKSLYNDLQKLL